MGQRLTCAQLDDQLREKDRQISHLQRQIAELRGEIREKEQSWIIDRNEVQMTNVVLGSGAWGRVSKGKFRLCDVAVKEIHSEILSPQIRTLFEREVDMASRCRHPCLLQFIGATNDERPLLVTELMDRNLRSLYEEENLNQEDVGVIALDVAQALNYLHQNKPEPIIHRDISSANVLIWQRGNQWRAKVSDYGTANFVRQSVSNYAGAPVYCAPEVGSGNPNSKVSCKIDVFSFGILLCEMCIRTQPDTNPHRRHRQVASLRDNTFQTLIELCLLERPGVRPNMEEVITHLPRPRQATSPPHTYAYTMQPMPEMTRIDV